jgi:hypothetical protein
LSYNAGAVRIYCITSSQVRLRKLFDVLAIAFVIRVTRLG